ncbi:MAG: hypothetical protein JOZ69_21550 [Myxococcales bacterium]|nr:hypothetical protein [Myxococcales bacterium]
MPTTDLSGAAARGADTAEIVVCGPTLGTTHAAHPEQAMSKDDESAQPLPPSFAVRMLPGS